MRELLEKIGRVRCWFAGCNLTPPNHMQWFHGPYWRCRRCGRGWWEAYGRER